MLKNHKIYTINMNYNSLKKINQELLKLDPTEFMPRRQLNSLTRMRSSIHAAQTQEEDNNDLCLPFLSTLKKFLTKDRVHRSKIKSSIHRPTLLYPMRSYNEACFCPPRYFSKGPKKAEPRSPIPYLLIETNEISTARPVPGNSLFLRSLAKGKGVLKQNNEGLFYLDIDNRFILSLMPYLKTLGLIRPPYFNLFDAPNGAHIPIIPPRESAFHFLHSLEAVNQEFTFEIEGLYSIEPTLWPEMEEVWFFKVHSPELEALRQRNFLSSRPGGHSFHIAVAVKPRKGLAKISSPLPLMRINIAFCAA